MKFINESIELARVLFPTVYKEKEKGIYRTFHWSFGFQRSKLVGIGQAYPAEPNGRALTFAKKFNNYHFYKNCYLHSEIDLLSKLWSRFHVTSKLKIVNIRLNAKGELRDAKPCKNCQKILDAIGINKIFYSTNGKVVKLEN